MKFCLCKVISVIPDPAMNYFKIRSNVTTTVLEFKSSSESGTYCLCVPPFPCLKEKRSKRVGGTRYSHPKLNNSFEHALYSKHEVSKFTSYKEFSLLFPWEFTS